MHAICRETYRIKGNIHDSFLACDQTCHSGCYHGSVERSLRGEEIYSQIDGIRARLSRNRKPPSPAIPRPPTVFVSSVCTALGHALLFFFRYQLVQSLEVCAILPEDWSRNSCYGGVFMENVFNATLESRDLSPTDYHYPRNRLDPKYRSECYVMQTSRMSEMGLTTAEVFRECEKAGEFRESCMLSAGRDLSNDVRFGQTGTAQKCELAGGAVVAPACAARSTR